VSTNPNPLLSPDLPDLIPPFDAVKTEHVEPAIRTLVERVLADVVQLERDVSPTWSGTVGALTAMTEPLYTAWGIVQHLMGVKNSPELRAAHDAVQKSVVQASMRVAQSEPVYKALVALREGPD